MYGNLKAEMARHEISTTDIASAIDVTDRTAKNKLTGKTEFLFSETIKIRDSFFPNWDIEKLFSD